MVDLDAALGEEFFDVAEGQAETQVPADRQHDHLGRKAEASEGRSRAGSRARAAGSHDNSLATQGSLAADATVPPSATRARVPGRSSGLRLESPLSAFCGSGRGSRGSWAQWPLPEPAQPGSIGASASSHQARQAKLAQETVRWPGSSARPEEAMRIQIPPWPVAGRPPRRPRCPAPSADDHPRPTLVAARPARQPDHDRGSDQPTERCRLRARHQVRGTASQSRSPVRLPPDTTVQQQPPQPVVGEVAKPCPSGLIRPARSR